MNDDAALYKRSNELQRRDAQQILAQFGCLLQWRADGHDRLLDVGCGTGDVLMDIIRPMLPEDFEEIVGVDISQNMVNYARTAYADADRTEFQLLDIECESLPQQLRSRFDHVTSFYCLQWVKKSKQSLDNIYQMLRETGGDCLLIFVLSHPIYDVYKTLAKDRKWENYMQDWEKFLPAFASSPDPCGDYSAIMQQAGFVDCNVQLLDMSFSYEGVQNLRSFTRSINPYIGRIPPEQQEDYLDDLVQVVEQMKLREYAEDIKDYRFIMNYKLLMAYGQKCDGTRAL